jgi:hypothetical protein
VVGHRPHIQVGCPGDAHNAVEHCNVQLAAEGSTAAARAGPGRKAVSGAEQPNRQR